jgi:hypothetical protein
VTAVSHARHLSPAKPECAGLRASSALVRDAADLPPRSAASRALLVGHDWGAMTPYGVGAFAPEVPGVSERVFEPLVRRLCARWSPGYAAQEDLARVVAALPTRERRAAAVSYHRAYAQPWRRTRRYAAEQPARVAEENLR